MKINHKPDGYNAVSPYFIIHDASRWMALMIDIFDAVPQRKYERPDGTIMHGEIKIDDSILMFAEATDQYPPNQLLNHVYVPDVDTTFQRAIKAGCESVKEPKENEGDPDRRGTFTDFAGNTWSVGMQIREE